MATSWERPSCPLCARDFRRLTGGEDAGLGVYTECERHEREGRLIREAARRAAARRRRSEASRRDWEDARLAERRGGLAGDMTDDLHPNPRRNADEAQRELRRAVAAGDDGAVLPLVRELVRSGAIRAEDLSQFVDRVDRAQIVGFAHETARRVEAMQPGNEHQGFTNYETFSTAVTLENNRGFYEGWAQPAIRRLWAASSDEERSERGTTYSGISVAFGDMIEAAVAGWAPEDPVRDLAPRNLKDLEPDLLAAGDPWPRDRALLGGIFTHLLHASLGRVDWRDIAAHWIHETIPGSRDYGVAP